MRAALLLIALGACRQAEPAPPGAAILARARALSAEGCACKDRGCGAAVSAKWDALTRALSGVTFSAEQVEGLTVEDQRFNACLTSLPGTP